MFSFLNLVTVPKQLTNAIDRRLIRQQKLYSLKSYTMLNETTVEVIIERLTNEQVDLLHKCVATNDCDLAIKQHKLETVLSPTLRLSEISIQIVKNRFKMLQALTKLKIATCETSF
jgi:hypothetical protein